MMEAARTSEMLVNFYQTTWHYNPEDTHLKPLKITNLSYHTFASFNILYLSAYNGEMHSQYEVKYSNTNNIYRIYLNKRQPCI
jgi:hypothetical protein